MFLSWWVIFKAAVTSPLWKIRLKWWSAVSAALCWLLWFQHYNYFPCQWYWPQEQLVKLSATLKRAEIMKSRVWLCNALRTHGDLRSFPRKNYLFKIATVVSLSLLSLELVWTRQQEKNKSHYALTSFPPGLIYSKLSTTLPGKEEDLW